MTRLVLKLALRNVMEHRRKSLTIGTIVVMIVVCVTASSLALLRIRKVEPAMVFR